MKKTAIFPAKEFITAAELEDFGGVSAQLAYYYRQKHDFPRSQSGKYRTAQVIESLIKRGYKIQVV